MSEKSDDGLLINSRDHYHSTELFELTKAMFSHHRPTGRKSSPPAVSSLPIDIFNMIQMPPEQLPVPDKCKKAPYVGFKIAQGNTFSSSKNVEAHVDVYKRLPRQIPLNTILHFAPKLRQFLVPNFADPSLDVWIVLPAGTDAWGVQLLVNWMMKIAGLPSLLSGAWTSRVMDCVKILQTWKLFEIDPRGADFLHTHLKKQIWTEDLDPHSVEEIWHSFDRRDDIVKQMVQKTVQSFVDNEMSQRTKRVIKYFMDNNRSFRSMVAKAQQELKVQVDVAEQLLAEIQSAEEKRKVELDKHREQETIRKGLSEMSLMEEKQLYTREGDGELELGERVSEAEASSRLQKLFEKTRVRFPLESVGRGQLTPTSSSHATSISNGKPSITVKSRHRRNSTVSDSDAFKVTVKASLSTRPNTRPLRPLESELDRVRMDPSTNGALSPGSGSLGLHRIREAKRRRQGQFHAGNHLASDASVKSNFQESVGEK